MDLGDCYRLIENKLRNKTMNRKQRVTLAEQHVAFNQTRKDYLRSQTQTYGLQDLMEVTGAKVKANDQPTIKLPKIEVSKEGCIDACLRIYHDIENDNDVNGNAKNKAKIGLLNFASAKHPGGGFLNGSLAQEEDICLKTDLYQYIKQETEFYNTASHSKHKGYYKDELMYTTGVQIIRDTNYQLLADFVEIDVITCPAPNRCGQILDAKMAKIGLQNRINMIMQAFAKYGCTHLVLGAFGCGVFKNDPKLVVELFAKAIKQYAYSELKTVVFAIKTNNDKDVNYRAFMDVLKK